MKRQTLNQLESTQVRNAQPENKPYRLRDGGNLYLEVLPSGSKKWRYAYKFNGKHKTLTLGSYPDMSLKSARMARADAAKTLADGLNPSQKQLNDHSFEAVAKAWLTEHKDRVASSTIDRLEAYLKRDVYPVLGNHNIDSIGAPHIIPIIKEVRDRGAADAAKRVKGFIQQVFDYAVVHGYCGRNPAKDIDIKLILPPRIKQHFATLRDPAQVGSLLRDIDGYQGGIATKNALWLSAYLFLRPGELRAAEWREINLDDALWVLPAKRRKLATHLKKANRPEDALAIPLAKQVVEKLRYLHQYTGHGEYLFPSPHSRAKPISNNAVRVALRAMGYENDDMTAHGFRGLASTQLNTLGYRSEVIEAQLGHKEKNEIRAAYNHADYLQERTTMMQEWANYLDSLRAGAQVVPIRQAQ